MTRWTKEAVFAVWAPGDGIWSVWAKPVLFAHLVGLMLDAAESRTGIPLPTVDWAPTADARTAVIVDVPGDQSVRIGAALAKRGFRPVPLYNGCPGPSAVVDVTTMMSCLCLATPALETNPPPRDAPPAFLLDSRRFTDKSAASPGKFDNRWMVVPQDFPSARTMLARGYNQAIVCQEHAGPPANDLSHVLLRWQEAGLQILSCGMDGAPIPQAITVRRPSGFRVLWRRAIAMLGFRRNNAGGFGSCVPDASGGSFG